MECDGCKTYYEKMCQADELEEAAFDEEIAKKTADSFKEVSKAISKKIVKTILKEVLIISMVAIGVVIGLWALIVLYVTKTASDTWETHYDISEYGMLDDGENLLERSKNLSAIWPAEITEEMNVTEYLLIHYCPWDSNYLGYLEVEYDEEDYEAEVERLKDYESTEYVGNYGGGVFKEKELLAIPKDCLPKGLDLSEDNPVRQEVLKQREKDLERHKEQLKDIRE